MVGSLFRYLHIRRRKRQKEASVQRLEAPQERNILANDNLIDGTSVMSQHQDGSSRDYSSENLQNSPTPNDADR